MPGSAATQGSPFGHASCTSTGSVSPLFFVGNSCGTPTSTTDQQQQNGLGLTAFPQMQQHSSTYGSPASGLVSYAGPAPTPPPISPPGGDNATQQMMPGTIGCNVPAPAQMPGNFGWP